MVLAVFLWGCTGQDMSPASAPVAQPDRAAAARGAYLAAAAGCITCHTDKTRNGPSLAGGRAITTPFGIYYSGNITPDPVTGIGRWSDADFVRAIREGISPDGAYYFPAFPFSSFTRMTDRDLLDLRAFLAQQPSVVQQNRAPDAPFPFDTRAAVSAWRLLYFTPGTMQADPHHTAEWNRGAYLAEAVAHCGECHTPRTALGGLDNDRRLAGTMDAKSGMRAPNITADPKVGVGRWSAEDIADFLKTGMTPEADVAGGAMTEVIEGTSHLSDADRHAIAEYLLTVASPSGTGAGP